MKRLNAALLFAVALVAAGTASAGRHDRGRSEGHHAARAVHGAPGMRIAPMLPSRLPHGPVIALPPPPRVVLGYGYNGRAADRHHRAPRHDRWQRAYPVDRHGRRGWHRGRERSRHGGW